jgi:hypothetical protein
MTSEFIVQHKQDLDALLVKPRKRLRIIFRLSSFSDQENQLVQARVNGLYNHCGCNYGAFAAFVAVFIFTISTALLQGFHVIISWKWVTALFLVFIFAAGIGKAFGIFLTRMQLKKLIKKINP